MASRSISIAHSSNADHVRCQDATPCRLPPVYHHDRPTERLHAVHRARPVAIRERSDLVLVADVPRHGVVGAATCGQRVLHVMALCERGDLIQHHAAQAR